MGLKYNKIDNLGKLFEEFAIDPDQVENQERANQAQKEAEYFLNKEQEQIAKQALEAKKENL